MRRIVQQELAHVETDTARANDRNPQLPFTTPWFDGTTKPERVGFYERHFTYSMMNGGVKWSMQYWDGEFWRIGGPSGKEHWRQVGDYPAWRGLTKDQHDLQTSAGR